MRSFHHKLLLLSFLISCSFSVVNGQEDEVLYKKKFTIGIAMGPTQIATENGIHMQNQFVMELRKLFSLSASYGTALTYSGMDNVTRLYLNNPDLSSDDFIRKQSLIFVNMTMQISPINTKHHRLFIGMGPSLNIYNSAVAEVIMFGDSVSYVLGNGHSETISFNINAGYDLTIGKHLVTGVSVYYSIFTEDMYSVLFSAGYRF